MRCVLSISLTLCFLLHIVNIGPGDFLKLSDLVSHAEMHSEKYGDSFLVFLTKHYGSLKKDHFDTHKEHEELPFNQNSHTSVTTVFVMNHQELPVARLQVVSHPPANFFYSASWTSIEKPSVFQPPQQV